MKPEQSKPNEPTANVRTLFIRGEAWVSARDFLAFLRMHEKQGHDRLGTSSLIDTLIDLMENK